MSLRDQWSHIPSELQKYPQWCVAGPDKAPYLGSIGKLYQASPVKGPWLTFEDACKLADHYNVNVGFVLTEDDPFTCIDLDVKDANSRKANGEPYKPEEWTSLETLKGFEQGIQTFNSYTELSTSGKGTHIWTEGDIGGGAKRGHIEVYSNSRFMVCTGNHIERINYFLDNANVVDISVKRGRFKIKARQQLLDQLKASLHYEGKVDITLEERDQLISDRQVVEKAMRASNADKFNKLCRGEWQGGPWPTQSEADLALLSMFCFYSRSNAQCRRLFRMTALGKREKAIKNDVYLDRTLKLIRGRQERQDLAAEIVERQADEFIATLEKAASATNRNVQATTETQPTPPQGGDNTAKKHYPDPGKSNLDWPPGFVGYLAKCFYHSAPRPIKEVAIVSALGLMAGICGKAFNIPQSGLNLYIILVARSAIGKEAMHSSIGLMCDQASSRSALLHSFVDFTEYASGPALTKACLEKSSFVNVAGEWGRRLKRMSADERLDGPIQQLRTVMTNLYQKSGKSSIVGGLGYSNKDNNIASVTGVAYSLIGESTPRTFYDSLTESMMEDGFLSRFVVIEYEGERPPLNKNPITQYPDDAVEHLCRIAARAEEIMRRIETVQVIFSPESDAMFDEFDEECDHRINATPDESKRQMWNRAHLKAMRVASLLAIGDNIVAPVVTMEHATWALSLIKNDIAIMSSRNEAGDIGLGDTAREKKVMSVIADYLKGPVAKSYGIPDVLRKSGIVTRKYIQQRVSSLSAFNTARAGSSLALDSALRSLVDSGYLVEVQREAIVEKFGKTFGRCFKVLYIGK